MQVLEIRPPAIEKLCKCLKVWELTCQTLEKFLFKNRKKFCRMRQLESKSAFRFCAS